jgi:ABC-2 type transport system ATP-binding protein
MTGVHGLQLHDHKVDFDVDTAQLADAVERLSAAGLRTLTSSPPTLEELVLRHYGDELADDLRHDDEPARG